MARATTRRRSRRALRWRRRGWTGRRPGEAGRPAARSRQIAPSGRAVWFIVSCIDITSRWVAEFHSAVVHDAGSRVARRRSFASMTRSMRSSRTRSYSSIPSAPALSRASPSSFHSASLCGLHRTGRYPNVTGRTASTPCSEGRPPGSASSRANASRRPGRRSSGPVAVRVAHGSRVGVLDVQHVRVGLCPAARHRAGRDVGEVVLQPLRQARVDERPHLGRERGRRVRAGDDQIDVGEGVVEVAFATADEVRHLLDAESSALGDPLHVRHGRHLRVSPHWFSSAATSLSLHHSASPIRVESSE